ncbi:structural maintenance of chromosomes protein 6-like isoform X2 [Tubulanus polymorphus]|uniref:structural maintenance of chromosomes protein 6-like isoform X2 n=1 Tax=Tubulanus polymorphus TaxID=672921 RepID=UPI003DA2B2F2
MSMKRKNAGASGPEAKRPRSDDEEADLSQTPDFIYQPTMGSEAESGIIEQVRLKNFMCHDYLEFTFGPHVNFVVGRNGSGKSAVLTALVVGLGGKASATSRGSAVKGFIKFHKQMAEVTVKLRNRGPDAYKHGEYGDTISVERRFNTDGSSQYKIRSYDGRIISNKREELTHILDQFNIQVENPVAVLNQETSRNFLHNSNPNQKYKFFLKATQLEQMKLDYTYANEQKDITLDIISNKEKMLPELEREVEDWEQKFRAICSLDDLKLKVDQLRNEVAWALVHAKEKDLEPIVKELRMQEARMPKFEQRCLESQEKVDASKRRSKEIQDELKKLADDAKKLQPIHEQTKKELNDARKRYRSTQLDYKRVDNDLKTCLKDKKQLLEKIAELRKMTQSDGKLIQRQLHIDKLEDELNQNHAQMKVSEHYLQQLRSALNQLKEQSYTLKLEEQEQQSIVSETRRKIGELESTRSNELRRFGKWCPDLLQKIDDAHQRGRFRLKPKGPLGSLIHLRDSNWALAIECSLGGQIKAFCCDNMDDSKVLQGLMSQLNIPKNQIPSILVSRFLGRRHDVSQHAAQTDKYPTVLDMLEIEDSVVANCLIDQRGIESIILIADDEEAKVVMDKHPPLNVREAYIPTGDQLYCLPTFRYYSTDMKQPQFLKVNVEEEIRGAQNELHMAEVRLKDVQQRKLTLESNFRCQQAEERKSNGQIMKIRESINNLTFEINELKNIEEPTPGDVVTLEEEVQKYNQQIDDLEQQIHAKKQIMNQAKEDFDQASETATKIDAEIKSIADLSDPVRDELAQCEDTVDTAEREKRHYDTKKKEQEKKIKDIRTRLDKGRECLAKDIMMAEEICPRINTRRTAQNLESEINQIQKRILSEEKNRGSKEEITQKYDEKKKGFVKIKKEVKQFNNFVKNLKAVMKHRQKQYEEFRRMIAMRARYFFIMMLSNRNYNGHIKFDHDKGHLALSVQPTLTNGEGSRDMRALSGGERSFATVCFLLALWDAMESPFRCLDEFDVYMDMVNRRISMDMMMTAAKEQRGRQFIFLTPQDTSHLKLGSDVCVYRMSDPERGQGRIITNQDNDDEMDMQ